MATEQPHQALMKENVRRLDERLEAQLERFHQVLASGEADETNGIALGIIASALPLYCRADSKHYRSAALIPLLERAGDAFLATQHESGCISLDNCNIDSPPDTAFTSHLAALLAQVGQRYATPELEGVMERLLLFLKRAGDALLVGGFHTPNHRWVISAALAKMEELFGGTAYRARAFQLLAEGLDVTEYGEWTERSNSIYNAVCAYYLFSVGKVFGHEPSLDAARRTLHMMRYMLHPGDTIVTEYSGRQDANAVALFNDVYAVAYHLLANRYNDPELAAMARVALRPVEASGLLLIHEMLESERMALPEGGGDQAPEEYTILYGGENTVPVPQDVWYTGPLHRHPHGASVLRHRRGKLSVTAMAGQQTLLYVQYGKARLLGVKLAAGWFGIGAVAFPGIRRVSDDLYRADITLKGSYFQPLPEELYRDAKGSYVDMPNELRERSNVVEVEIAVEFKLYEDGVDLRIVSQNRKGVYLQPVFSFDPAGKLEGDGLEDAGSGVVKLKSGAAVFTAEGDTIRVEEGAAEHPDVSMRNDTIRPSAINMAINLKTPTDKILRIRCAGAKQ